MNKKRVYAYVDGFNLYHNLQHKIYRDKWKKSFQWCNFRKLLKTYLQDDEALHMIYFFTAYAVRSPQAVSRHEILNAALRNVGVDVVLGKFSKVTRKYRNKHGGLVDIYYDAQDQESCKMGCEVNYLEYRTYEEKETDVNMSLKILEDGLLNKYDKAFIVTGDSDIVPAIVRLKDLIKSNKIDPKEFINIVIPGTKGKTMRRVCDGYTVMGYKAFEDSLFESDLLLSDGRRLSKPFSRT